MKFNYDRVADAVYLNLGKGKIKKTVEVSSNVIADIGEKGKVIGIEILNFSRQKNNNKSMANLLEFGVPMQMIESTTKIA
jgi:uncharacterized protein YuzE